ncbi:hypothetical protein EXB91_24760 [Salmonella enterica subsp. enterica serovar Florida]|uniref:Lipoprotein n=1 Tax=Salmonella newport TaxID=108619 RepID=A0A5Y0S182_SALNE|nr:hypothetical protein [Salmonella enterica]ECB7109647.1 hypothetical protein [Salmonella enterica subsp. enterica serovar Newport]ECG3786837.1 hypothetical protein [Salmonella enterica subsp. enterica serovar Florida]EKQ9927442.1 hypothetical protein [Salmonella enterica subsp. enterica serovar Panama]ECF2112530.1 hypothetical protein [Salmonella enterica subsp. enterica serovar Newport]ECJ3621824.1 hypothetical protein [Salmonella enterica subsp. enterica serovar Newport]
MKYIIHLTIAATLLVGCASSKGKPVEVVNANRAAGTVEVGFVKDDALPLADDGRYAQWENAPGIASQVCKRWGYDHAVELTPHSREVGMRNGYGYLMNGSITKLYQCLKPGEN